MHAIYFNFSFYFTIYPQELQLTLVSFNIRNTKSPVCLRGGVFCPASPYSSSFLRESPFVEAATCLPCDPVSQVCCVPQKVSLVMEWSHCPLQGIIRKKSLRLIAGGFLEAARKVLPHSSSTYYYAWTWRPRSISVLILPNGGGQNQENSRENGATTPWWNHPETF